MRANGQTPAKRLKGLVPAAEDWHAKANLLGVCCCFVYCLHVCHWSPFAHFLCAQLIWRYFYSAKSAAEHGTLYQIRNAINRRNVVQKPLKDFNACEDFFILVVECHILAASMEMMKVKTKEDTPSTSLIPDGVDTWVRDDEDRRKILEAVCKEVVSTFVNVQLIQMASTSDDKVNVYAK